MELILNGEKIVTQAATLSELLTERGIAVNGVAVAVGSRIVRRDEWKSASLSEGVVITVIRATQGG